MWMRVDDGLHAHRKTRRVTKSHHEKVRDASPMGLWVLAGSWAAQNGSDGWVPEDELDRFDDDWRSLAQRLTRAGYWWPQQRDGEAGYGFNDWHDYNPESEAASRSGVFGNHVRWHANKGVVDPACEHCPSVPIDPEDHPEPPTESSPESGGDRGAISGADRVTTSGGIALPVPDPTPPHPNPTPASSAKSADERAEARGDVERICQHLAESIEGNGSKPPAITAKWRQAARLMLDKDGRTEEDVHRAIDWCQGHEFWRANVLSLPTLREKYDTLRLQAQRSMPGPQRRGDIDWDAALGRARQIDAGGGIA